MHAVNASVAQIINDLLVDSFAPVHLDVINESHRHNVPENAETHFKLVIVSEHFRDQSLVQRHRSVNTLLADQLTGPVHALSMYTHTPQEWLDKGGVVPESPPCRGGGVS